MQRIKPMNAEGNQQLAATYRRITETRGYVSNILMSLSHAPAGLEPHFPPRAKRKLIR